MTNVFLSYSRKDSAFAKELYRRLQRDGVDVFFDKESMRTGANWVNALQKELAKADFVVLVLSPDFMDSEWCNREWTSADKDKIRPLLLRDVEKPRFLRPIQHIDVRTTEAFEQNYPQICTALGGMPKVISRKEYTGFLGDRHKLPCFPVDALVRSFSEITSAMAPLRDSITSSRCSSARCLVVLA